MLVGNNATHKLLYVEQSIELQSNLPVDDTTTIRCCTDAPVRRSVVVTPFRQLRRSTQIPGTHAQHA